MCKINKFLTCKVWLLQLCNQSAQPSVLTFHSSIQSLELLMLVEGDGRLSVVRKPQLRWCSNGWECIEFGSPLLSSSAGWSCRPRANWWSHWPDSHRGRAYKPTSPHTTTCPQAYITCDTWLPAYDLSFTLGTTLACRLHLFLSKAKGRSPEEKLLLFWILSKLRPSPQFGQRQKRRFKRHSKWLIMC